MIGIEDAYIDFPATITLYELKEYIENEKGLSLRHQILSCEEAHSEQNGFLSALKSSITHMTSRDRVRENFVDWINFFFLPEAINREVRGKGVGSWLKQIVMYHLESPPPMHITRCRVLGAGGRFTAVDVSSTATITRFKEEVEKQTTWPIGQYGIVISEEAQGGIIQRVLLFVVRAQYKLILIFLGIISSCLRWMVLGSNHNQLMKLKIQKNDKAAVDFQVNQDITLADLQRQIQLQYGDRISLDGLLLSHDNVNIKTK